MNWIKPKSPCKISYTEGMEEQCDYNECEFKGEAKLTKKFHETQCGCQTAKLGKEKY